MTSNPAILAIDQGTTSSRAIVFDRAARIVAVAQEEFPQHYPANGWVEHNPEDLWTTTQRTCRQALADAAAKGFDVVCAGITNQRETTVVWERATGQAIHNAIVWQDRRTQDTCAALRTESGNEALVRERTGLLLDPYFSASKIAWILDYVDGARAKAEAGDLAFGTVDSFLVNRLTQGAVHATDVTNACRTALFNLHSLDWDEDMLRLWRVPRALLPDVHACTHNFGMIPEAVLGKAMPILGIAGDQQAALIGQACFAPGMLKSTYGTGAFLIVNTGNKPVPSQHRLLGTVGYQLKGDLAYAIEGAIFIAGASVQWLRDGLKMIDNAAATEPLAQLLEDNGGVYLVPAFTGLGAPYWNPAARGGLFGITRDTGIAAIARAALESVAYQTHDLFEALGKDGMPPHELRVDGGMVANRWLVQFLADVLNVPVTRPRIAETTALGAAFAAGLQADLYGGLEDITALWEADLEASPTMPAATRERLLKGWSSAVHAIDNLDH